MNRKIIIIISVLSVCFTLYGQQTTLASNVESVAKGTNYNTCVNQGSSSDQFQQNCIFWEATSSVVTAVGTLILACLALFGGQIRQWIARPKLAITTRNSTPFIELLEEEDESQSATTPCQRIRIQVTNTGIQNARQCSVMIERIYKKRPQQDGLFILKEFVPKPFTWHSGKETSDVIRNIPAYIEISEISKNLEKSSSAENTPESSPIYTLRVLISPTGTTGTFLDLGAGCFIIALLVYAENLRKPLREYVQIYWSGASSTDVENTEKFNIEILDSTTVRKMKEIK